MTTVEGLSCGTPGIVYNKTASPELVTPDTGRVVEAGNISELLNAIYEIKNIGKSAFSKACRERVLTYFDKDKQFNKYIELYERLIAYKEI